MQRKAVIGFLLLFELSLMIHDTKAYSALEDARLIADYKRKQELDHAKVARTLVHQANWASVGTISTNSEVLGYPMVNILAVDDSSRTGASTGKTRFMLTDLDFTGPDWKANNKVTFLYSDEQKLNCKRRGEDPMEPTCARTMISGKVKEMSNDTVAYADAMQAFEKRHPAAKNWKKEHAFYLCELEIENIFVLDYYGGPHKVSNKDYYSTDPEEEYRL